MKRQWQRLVVGLTLLAFLFTSTPSGLTATLRSHAAPQTPCASSACDCRHNPTTPVKKSCSGCGECITESENATEEIAMDRGPESQRSSCPCCPNCPGCCWCSIAKAPCVPASMSGVPALAECGEYVLDPSFLFPPTPCQEIIQPPKI